MRATGGLRGASVLALVIVSTWSVSVRAQDAPPPSPSTLGSSAQEASTAAAPTREELERAAVLFERSALAYAETRFDAAAALLVEAYALSHEPILLYNLGRAHEGAGDVLRALEAYRLYLERAPDAENASLVRERVDGIEQELADAQAERERVRREEEEARRAREAEAERVAAEQEEARRRAEEARRQRAAEPSPWPWVVAGAGVAGLGAALAVGVVAMERHAAAAGAATQVEAVARFDDAQTLAIGANVGLVLGGALLGVGIAWGVVDLTDDDHDERDVQVSFGPGSVAVRGSF